MVVILAAVLVAACNSTVVEPEEEPCWELEEIDSLMWKRADSAFAMLQAFVVSPMADSLDEFEEHYCQLLISELLYKNDYGQSNRDDLLKAVDYFDSLTANTRSVPQLIRNVFLDARAHYISGVGYYETDNVVPACAEYLKALEIMENNFEEKELVGHKAQFMALIYNRLGDLFSKQFMMESAIKCLESSLVYCKIEQTSPQGIPKTLLRIGKQYDAMNDLVTARSYYAQAEEGAMKKTMLYRDIVASKTLCDYRYGVEIEQVMDDLNRIVIQAVNEEERLDRFLIVGAIWAEEGVYDSALAYLVPVFQNTENTVYKINAAESMRVIFDNLGDKEKSDECARFLANHKKSEGETKVLISKLENMFKDYQNQKHKRQAKADQMKVIKKTVNIIVPIAIAVALTIIVFAKYKSKKLLKEQQEEADRVLKKRDKLHTEAIETERQNYRMQQAAISSRLKHKSQEVRELKDQIKQVEILTTKTETATSFNEEPVCRLIMERVREGRFKSKIDYINYKDSALSKQQLLDLHLAVDRHFGQFTIRLKNAYPPLTNSDLDYCCLYLLGLTDADIAALMQRTYNTVFERDYKIRKILGSKNPLPITLMGIAKDSSLV